MSLGDHEKAIPYLENHIKKNQDDIGVEQTLAQLYMKSNNWEKAITLLKKMTNENPNRDDLHESYIESLIRNGKINFAIIELEEFLIAHPNNKNAKLQIVFIHIQN